MSMAPVACMTSGNEYLLYSMTQSMASSGPAMKPSSDIALFTTTLPRPASVSLMPMTTRRKSRTHRSRRSNPRTVSERPHRAQAVPARVHTWHANALLTGVRTPTDEHGRSDTNGGARTRAQDVERTGFALLRIRSLGWSADRRYLTCGHGR